MLNPFPVLLSFAFLLGPLPLRLIVGVFLVIVSIYHFRTKDGEDIARLRIVLLAGVEMLLGLLLIAGAYTQVAAIGGILISIKLLYLSWRHPHYAPHGKWAYAFLGLTSLSLLFLGAGAFAFDLPL